MAKMPAVLEEHRRDEAIGRAADYFARAGQPDAPFTGANFETVGHRWDEPAHTNRITESDLLALSMLSVPPDGRAVQQVLSADFQSEASALLAEVPTHVSIGTPGAFHTWLAPGKAMHRLWHLVFHVDGLGVVSTSKLLARKRADLVPVYDAVISTGWDVQRNENSWEAMHTLLSKDDGALLTVGEQIRTLARIPRYVAPLRVLDAVVWHAGSNPSWSTAAPVVDAGGDVGEP